MILSLIKLKKLHVLLSAVLKIENIIVNAKASNFSRWAIAKY